MKQIQTGTIGIFGEVLFDCFPDGHTVLGGAPFNVAWHLQAFKQSIRFISRIGVDAEAGRISRAMQAWGMVEESLQTDAYHPTGKVSISLSPEGEPSYHILDQQAYDYIDAEQIPDLNFKLLYHGSLALRHPVSRFALQTLKSRHSAKIFMDVNLRSPWWDRQQLYDWLAGANWLKLNHLELQLLQEGEFSLQAKMQAFHKRFQLDGLVVTCGGEGAFALGAEQELLQISPEIVVKVVDTVGAGDAFSAVLLLGIQLNWPLSVSLERAQCFACAIVQQQGAIVEDLTFYQAFMQKWLL